MDTLLDEIRKGLEYLDSQGKKVNNIKMNPKILENMTKKINGVDDSNDLSTVFGITIEADKNIEKFAFVLEEIT